MSADEPRRRRRLNDHEHALWRGVTRSVAPLKRGRGRKIADEPDAPVAPTQVEAIGSKRKSKPAPATRNSLYGKVNTISSFVTPPEPGFSEPAAT